MYYFNKIDKKKKKKVGTLYGKPIVVGDKNLVTKNEQHISELGSSSSKPSSSASDDYIVKVYEGNEYVWAPYSPRGEYDEDKVKKYKACLQLFAQFGNVFEYIYQMSYAEQAILYRADMNGIYSEISKTDTSYVYNSIIAIRESTITINGQQFKSLAEFLVALGQITTESEIEAAMEAQGFTRIPYADFVEMKKQMRQ